MRILIPLPFGEIDFTVRTKRRARPLFWCMLLSVALHVLVISLAVAFLAPQLLPVQKEQTIYISMSSALQIQRRPIPRPADAPRPHAVPNPQPKPQPRTQTEESAAPEAAPQAHREPAVVRLKRGPDATLADKLAADNQAFAKTAANLNAANDPRAGLAQASAAPAAPKRYAVDLSGTLGKPQPEGVLYPIKRWVDGAYVYYYVRYSAEYANGDNETGTVPWPIRFPAKADPFARGIRRMALPGPPSGFTLPDGTPLAPLVKNCYDHRYDYCPIEREDA